MKADDGRRPTAMEWKQQQEQQEQHLFVVAILMNAISGLRAALLPFALGHNRSFVGTKVSPINGCMRQSSRQQEQQAAAGVELS
ncbi:hypothetical protein AWZ03_011307 [Drosophila navojoa]|uniref:Uncharacterized protein n=1 Tax=Drosophila navojoa TaxID=7232 RepID=A0A484B2F2_DRONA|nr:hypothetical protein AWZ03_011307 [Drosophila navojoa]